MQDTLQYFALDSVEDYCHGIERHCPESVQVSNLLEASSVFPRAELVSEPPVRGGSLQLRPPGRCKHADAPADALKIGDTCSRTDHPHQTFKTYAQRTRARRSTARRGLRVVDGRLSV